MVTVLGIALILYVQFEVRRETSGPTRAAHPLFYDAQQIERLMQEGEYDGALKAARNALEQYTGRPYYSIREMEGDALGALGHDSEALQPYQDCVDSEPSGYWVPWMKLAATQERLGLLDEARSTYEDLLGRYPGHEEAQDRLERLLKLVDRVDG